MAKCSSLWNAASRFLKCHEAFERIAHRALVQHCPTTWNSLYDSLKVLVILASQLSETPNFILFPSMYKFPLH